MILIATCIHSALLPATNKQVQETFPEIWEVLCNAETKSSLEINEKMDYCVFTIKERKACESKAPIQEF